MKKTKHQSRRDAGSKPQTAGPPAPGDAQRADNMTAALLHLQRRGSISPDQHDQQVREITQEIECD